MLNLKSQKSKTENDMEFKDKWIRKYDSGYLSTASYFWKKSKLSQKFQIY